MQGSGNLSWSRCFDPRLRVEATRCGTFGIADAEVSIHASVWEATSPYRRVTVIVRVSIHASVWEATAWLL